MALVQRTMGAISGRVVVPVGGTDRPLRGVRVDVYRFNLSPDGSPRFERMNRVSARTDATGQFSFTDPADLQVPVEVKLVGSGVPPYTPVERVLARSLPSLAFRVTVDSSVLSPGETSSLGSDFRDVFDERPLVGAAWVASHPSRVQVSISTAISVTVSIDPSVSDAAVLAGADAAPTLPGTMVHLLRVGRVTRDEIQPVGSGKAGYMTSGAASFLPGVVDAPFGGTLHIAGAFGASFPILTGDLYYALSFARYGTGTAPHTDAVGAAYDPSLLSGKTALTSPLVNRRYILPTSPADPGRWENLHLGPFDGTITAVDTGLPATAVGASVQVYRRPPAPNPAVEYYPFWDLLAVWDSSAAPNDLVVIQIEVYERIGGTVDRPNLRLRAFTPSVNDHLPLRIDNRPPVPKLEALRQGHAAVTGPLEVASVTPIGECGDVTVTGAPAGRNVCLLPTFSVEDGSGGAHSHVAGYSLAVRYSPRGALGSQAVVLQSGVYSGYGPISGSYSPSVPPVLSVSHRTAVVTPAALAGWPPQSDGATPCPQYAASLDLSCSVRTINGWGRAFGVTSLSRYFILSR